MTCVQKVIRDLAKIDSRTLGVGQLHA
jgi:hypothetical protein